MAGDRGMPPAQTADQPKDVVVVDEHDEVSSRDQMFWNLAQAAAWVVFRDMAVVDRFSPPAAKDWAAFLRVVNAG